MSLQTPLARARGLGSSKEGLHHWTAQRLTAIALVPLSLWFIFSTVSVISKDYSTVTLWLQAHFNAVLMLLFITAMYYHAALGLQVVIEDYVASKWQKIGCLVLIRFLVFFAGLSSALAVIKVYLGL